MPPLGIDRFNFVCGDPLLEIQGGTVHGCDAAGMTAPWDGQPLLPVPPGHVGFFDGQQFQAWSMDVHLSVGPPGGPYVDVHFHYDVPPRLVEFWIGNVVVGIHATPAGPNAYAPFGLVEIVNGDDAHWQMSIP